jgi:long-subunit fatty acid transport protein
LQRDISGLKEKFYSPTLPDASSWGLSLGGSFRLARGFRIDAGAFLALMDEVTAEDPNSPEGTFRGRYDTNVLIFSLAVGWTPGARSTMQ